MDGVTGLGNLDALQELTWELFWSYFRDDYLWFVLGLAGLLLVLFGVNYFTRTGAMPVRRPKKRFGSRCT